MPARERCSSAAHQEVKNAKGGLMRPALFATMFIIGFWPHASSAQSCPVGIPRPATQSDIACFLARPPQTLCATALSPTVCFALNNTALGAGLVTPAGYQLLQNVGFCAISVDFGAGS